MMNGSVYHQWINYNDPNAGSYSIAVGHRRWLTTFTADALTGSQQIISSQSGFYDNTGNYNSQYRNHPEVAWNYHYTTYPRGFDTDKGTLGIVVQANDTFDTINTALLAIQDNLYYCSKNSTYYTVQTDLIIVGSFWFTAATVLKKYNIHIFSGSIHYQNANYAGGFENCTLMFTGALSAYYRFYCSLKNCSINTNSNSGYELSSINGSAENCNFNSSNANPFLVAIDSLNDITAFTRLKWSYPQSDWFLKKITIIENYIQIGGIASLLIPELFIESMKIIARNIRTTYDFYFVNNIDNQIVRLRDFIIDTDRPISEGIDYINDLKPRIYWERTTIWNLIYDYKIDLTIKDQEGNLLTNAAVIIINLLSQETYDLTTDDFGKISTFLITRTAQSTGAVGYATNWINKENFKIIINKAGFMQYQATLLQMRKPVSMDIFLIPVPEPVIVKDPINSLPIRGTITQQSIQGILKQQKLLGTVCKS